MPHAYADQSIVDTVSKAATDVANDPATSGAAASAGADVVYSDTLPAQQGSADPAEPSQAAQVCCAVRHHAMLCSVGSRYAVQHGITLCCAVWHHAMLCGVASRYAVRCGITLCCAVWHHAMLCSQASRCAVIRGLLDSMLPQIMTGLQ